MKLHFCQNVLNEITARGISCKQLQEIDQTPILKHSISHEISSHANTLWLISISFQATLISIRSKRQSWVIIGSLNLSNYTNLNWKTQLDLSLNVYFHTKNHEDPDISYS